MDAYLSRYMLYYPSTLLKGEFIYKHTRNYRHQQCAPLVQQAQYAERRFRNIVSIARRNSSFSAGRLEEFYTDTPFTDVVQGTPFLQKADLIKHIDEIVTYKSKLASAKTTGGSTGEPVKLYKNPDALARERAATWRSYGWAGITIGDRPRSEE